MVPTQNIYKIGNNMAKKVSLSENYKRWFGEFNQVNELNHTITKPTPKVNLTEQQRRKWDKVIESFNKQFKGHALTIKEGMVRVNGFQVEPINKFIGRPMSEILVILKDKTKK